MNFRFLFSYLFVFIVLLIRIPSLGYKAEFYAEAATNFFYYPYFLSFSEIYLYPESGYYPFVQKFISYVLFGVFKFTTYSPLLLQIFSVLSISFFVSLINFNRFRYLIKSDILRFLCGFSFLIFPDYDIFSFINFIYFGIIFLFLYLNLGKTKITLFSSLLVSFVSFSIIFSKALLLPIAPVAGLLFLYSIYSKNYKHSIILLGMLFGALLQTTFTIYQVILSPRIQERFIVSLIDIINLSLDTHISIFFYKLHFFKYLNFNFLKFFFISLLIIIIFFLYRKNKKSLLITIINIQIVSLIALVIAFSFYFDESKMYLKIDGIKEMPYMRWYFISHQLLLLLIFILIDQFKNNKLKIIVAIIFTIQYQPLMAFINQKDKYENGLTYSSWSKFHFLISNISFYIPVNLAHISKNSITSTSFIKNKSLIGLIIYNENNKKLPESILSIEESNKMYFLKSLITTLEYQYWILDKPKKLIEIDFLDINNNLIQMDEIMYIYEDKN